MCGSNFSVGDVGSVGLKHFGVGSMGGISPNVLAWVGWVHKVLDQDQKMAWSKKR